MLGSSGRVPSRKLAWRGCQFAPLATCPQPYAHKRRDGSRVLVLSSAKVKSENLDHLVHRESQSQSPLVDWLLEHNKHAQYLTDEHIERLRVREVDLAAQMPDDLRTRLKRLRLAMAGLGRPPRLASRPQVRHCAE
jgi:hypothetical protein